MFDTIEDVKQFIMARGGILTEKEFVVAIAACPLIRCIKETDTDSYICQFDDLTSAKFIIS